MLADKETLPVSNDSKPLLVIEDDEGLVLVEGSVPGPKGGIVTVRTAVKKGHKRALEI